MGSEIQDAIPEDGLRLWRACKLSKELFIQTVGCRYLRLDRRVRDYARLSPSFLREFLTYSVIGLTREPASVDRRTLEVGSHIEEVSRSKSELAYRLVSSLMDRLENEISLADQVSFILGGDIVYNMAHDVPRPERSTGKMVNGSDMDIVVIVHDRFPDPLMDQLDEAIYQKKQRILSVPHLREEIDYVVKKMDRIREQIQFNTFRRMLACKILQEGAFLYGSEKIFQVVKSMLKDYGITDKLAEMERAAKVFRGEAEAYLLSEDLEKIRQESLYLFYPTDESEEFQ